LRWGCLYSSSGRCAFFRARTLYGLVRCWRAVLDGSMSEWLSPDDPRLSRVKQRREAILAEVGHTHLATIYWPGDKGPWHTTYDKKPLNGQVTRWQVWIGEDGARRRILG
jgi:hypothetical protein